MLFIKRPRRSLVVAWHLVALALSFAAPVLLPQGGYRATRNAVLTLAGLGVLNGLLGAAWCGRIEPAISKLPMLGITLGGFVLMVLMVLESGPIIRLF